MEFIEPYNPQESLFYQVITRKNGLRMPYLQEPLSRKEIRDVKRWIKNGAHQFE